MIENETINVLYVDDEPNNLISFQASFRRYFNVFIASSANEAEIVLNETDIHVLITDQRMPVKTGTELLADAVKKYPDQLRILLTGYTDIQALADAVNNGHIFKYLQKPWNEEDLKASIEMGSRVFVLRQKEKKLKEELQQKKQELDLILKQKPSS